MRDAHRLAIRRCTTLVRWVRARTCIDFDAYWPRHMYATDLLRSGVPVEVVACLLGHASQLSDDGLDLVRAPDGDRHPRGADSGWGSGRQVGRRRDLGARRVVRHGPPDRRHVDRADPCRCAPGICGPTLVVDAADPAVSSGPCQVPGCDRLTRGHGLCAGHHQRWAKAGRPDVVRFAATTDSRWARQQPKPGLPGPLVWVLVRRERTCASCPALGAVGAPDLTQWLASGRPLVKAQVAPRVCDGGMPPVGPQAAGPLCPRPPQHVARERTP